MLVMANQADNDGIRSDNHGEAYHRTLQNKFDYNANLSLGFFLHIWRSSIHGPLQLDCQRILAGNVANGGER